MLQKRYYFQVFDVFAIWENSRLVTAGQPEVISVFKGLHPAQALRPYKHERQGI
jgi:hypothetical protein